MRPLNTLLIGCGGMGRTQARILAGLPEYRLVAVADVDPAAAAAVGGDHGCRHGSDAVALMRELRGGREPRLPELLAKMSRVDLVVVEGFKREPHRKIEVYRAANEKPLLFPDDSGIVGIATDTAVETTLPTAHLDDIEAVAAMMLKSAISLEDVLAKCEAEG